MGSENFFVRVLLRLARLAFWAYRKIGPPDFVTAIVLFSLAVGTGLISVLLYFGTYKNYVSVGAQTGVWLNLAVAVCSIGAGLFGGFYVYRLRKIGITSADAVIEAGLNYRGALERVGKGFDFLGIGASKLTAEATAFTDAIVRIGQNQQQARILLCDPRSSAIERLEARAGVGIGSFKTNVKQSFTFLENLHHRFRDNLQIRLYNPDSENQLPPFRLMFINQNLCLVSQIVLGAMKEGRLLPQLHVQNHPFVGLDPTFYQAYSTLFEQLWAEAHPLKAEDFQEISRIDVNANRRGANA